MLLFQTLLLSHTLFQLQPDLCYHIASENMRKQLLILLSLSIIGLTDSLYLTWEHYSGFVPPCSAHFTFIDCGKVLTSSYSVIFGVPLALLGVLHYFFLSLSIIASLNYSRKIFRYAFILLSVAGFVTSLYFMYLQLIVIGSICLYCTTSAIDSFIVFGLGQYFLSKERKEFVSSLSSFLYQHLLKKLFFRIDPEIIHELLTSAGEILGRFWGFKKIVEFLLKLPSKPKLIQKIAGVNFPNPVGLSAGFDYEAKLTQILPAINFGFGTIGTITNLPYEGNSPPRLGRLPKSKSLMVNKGFKNPGADRIIEKLENNKFEIPIGISIGRTNNRRLTTVKESIEDIVSAFKKFEHSYFKHSYYELNISCPNLFGSISFYLPDHLKTLLIALDKLNIKKPVFVKMPIEKSNHEVISMLEIIKKFKFIKGIIFGNLQKNRKDVSLDPNEVAKFKTGNFSGKPCEKRSNELIKLTYKKYGKKMVIIGVGGIFSAEDAYRKIKLGASLVQLITGMIYQGPQLITEINIGLSELLEKDGYRHISQATGKDNRTK